MRLARRLRRSPLVPATLISAAGIIPVTVVPVLYPAIAVEVPDFTFRLLGLSTTLCFAVISLSAPFVGRAVDAIGARRGGWLVAMGITAVLLLIATARSALMIVVAVACSGLVHAFAATSSNVVMGAVLDGRRPATLFGVRQAAVPLTSMTAGAVVALTTGVLSWRAVVALFLVVPVALAVFRPVASESATRRNPMDGLRLPAARAPLPRRELMVFAAISLFSGMAVSSLATFGVATLTEVGWGAAEAGAIFAVASAIGLGTRVVAGVVVDRRGWSVFGIAAALLVGGACGALLMAPGSSSGVALGVLLAYGAGWGFPGLLQYGIALSFRARIASATGLVHLGSGIGVSAGPLVFSELAAWGGLGPAWTAVACSSAVAATIAAWRFRSGRRVDALRTI